MPIPVSPSTKLCWRTLLAAAILSAVGLAVPERAHAERSCLGAICIDSGEEGGAVVFHAINRTQAPVSIQIAVETQNLEAYPKLPSIQLVPAGGFRKIAQYVPRSEHAGWSYRYTWSWVLGDPRAQHSDGYRYRVPFGGLEPRRVSQGNQSEFTHQGAHAYAFDFAMPIGTPILAARGGQVVMVNDGYTQQGLTPDFLSKANAVYILHDDRTVATYAHLDPGAGVREGMRVNTGDLIGWSGNTGFSTGPHLHFSVWKPGNDNRLQTLPIRFWSPTDAAGFVPTRGMWLPPSCHPGGTPCAPESIPAKLGQSGEARMDRAEDGACHCANGSVITTHLPCRMVCPKH